MALLLEAAHFIVSRAQVGIRLSRPLIWEPLGIAAEPKVRAPCLSNGLSLSLKICQQRIAQPSLNFLPHNFPYSARFAIILNNRLFHNMLRLYIRLSLHLRYEH